MRHVARRRRSKCAFTAVRVRERAENRFRIDLSSRASALVGGEVMSRGGFSFPIFPSVRARSSVTRAVVGREQYDARNNVSMFRFIRRGVMLCSLYLRVFEAHLVSLRSRVSAQPTRRCRVASCTPSTSTPPDRQTIVYGNAARKNCCLYQLIELICAARPLIRCRHFHHPSSTTSLPPPVRCRPSPCSCIARISLRLLVC